jgi:hypothetical protein
MRRVALNNDGLFEVPGLAPGDYTVEVKAPGFAPLTRRVRLEIGQQMRLDLTLSLGEVHESVDVAARAETLKTSDASLGEVVESKSIQELPLNGRMLLDLALTVLGAHVSHGAQAGDMNPLYWRPGQASAISIGGNRPNANYFLVDGVSNTDPTFNNFGGSVGGPLFGKKTFFFVNYEACEMMQAVTATDTVPTAFETAGNFSQSGVTV